MKGDAGGRGPSEGSRRVEDRGSGEGIGGFPEPEGSGEGGNGGEERVPSGTGGAEAGAKGHRPPSTSVPRRFGRGLVRLALTGLVTWFIVRTVGLTLDDLAAYDLGNLEPRWGFLAVSTLLLLLAYLYSASLWGLMVRELGGPTVGTPAALRVFFTANLGRYLPGKVWQLAGLAFLARKEGVPAGTATGAALLGQAFSLAGAALVGLGVLLRGGWGGEEAGKWAAVVIFGLLLALTFPAILRPLARTLIRKAQGELSGPLWPDPAFGVRWVGLYGVSWVLQGGAFWLLAMGLGMTLEPLLGLSVFPAAYLMGYLAFFAPAGIGIREGFLIVFLSPILGTGAAVLAVVARLWTTLVELGPAVLLAGEYLRPSRGERQGGKSA